MAKLDKDLLADMSERVQIAEKSREAMYSEREAVRRELREAQEREKTTRAQFDDLKQRLQQAETDNQFLRGYLARVQEDDHVREELVAIGDPAGEQQLVPKRKSVRFERPDDFSNLLARDEGYFGSSESRSKSRRHWITY